MATLTLKRELAILSDAAKYDASFARADLRQRVEPRQMDLF